MTVSSVGLDLTLICFAVIPLNSELVPEIKLINLKKEALTELLPFSSQQYGHPCGVGRQRVVFSLGVA